mmetsp:Transcript_27472/g.66482  ORF Transcript_27472/g.66482 Transcript_27472/m.66482 type:complete len:380 (-) Transcript_27472:65-1204(-)
MPRDGAPFAESLGHAQAEVDAAEAVLGEGEFGTLVAEEDVEHRLERHDRLHLALAQQLVAVAQLYVLVELTIGRRIVQPAARLELFVVRGGAAAGQPVGATKVHRVRPLVHPVLRKDGTHFRIPQLLEGLRAVDGRLRCGEEGGQVGGVRAGEDDADEHHADAQEAHRRGDPLEVVLLLDEGDGVVAELGEARGAHRDARVILVWVGDLDRRHHHRRAHDGEEDHQPQLGGEGVEEGEARDLACGALEQHAVGRGEELGGELVVLRAVELVVLERGDAFRRDGRVVGGDHPNHVDSPRLQGAGQQGSRRWDDLDIGAHLKPELVDHVDHHPRVLLLLCVERDKRRDLLRGKPYAVGVGGAAVAHATRPRDLRARAGGEQ